MVLDEGGAFLTEADLVRLVEGKSVFYTATTYTDYLRVQQEIRLVRKYASQVTVVTYDHSSYVLRLLGLYFYLLFHRLSKYDVVFVGFAPQLILPFWRFKFRDVSVISDFFISFYDTLVNDRKKFGAHSIVAKLLFWLDCRTVKQSDFIIADTKTHAEYFHKTFLAGRQRTCVVYLEADPRYYYPRQNAKPKYLQDKFVVLYFGSVIPLQGVDVVVRAAELTADLEAVHFVLIGPLSSAQKEVLNRNNNVTHLDWVTQHELADWISFSDLCLAGHFNDEIDKAKNTIPGKAYIYEAMGKLIVLGDNPANRERYPKRYEKVRFVQMGSAEALNKIITEESGCSDE